MANPIETAYAGLKDELTIGPSHHRFQLIRKLHDHFMGSLWLAEDVSTAARTEVSLLILRPELVRHTGVAEQMRKLVTRLRSALKHPHIATCYGYFSWRGLEFLSLEHLDGQTLSDLFRRKQAQKLSDRQKQGLLIQLAKAVDSGQLKLGKPHALLAPDLIFLNTGGGVKLTGFGWRQILDPLLSLLPQPPDYPAYQAPEAFHPQNQTARSDVYALALIAWELYSGKRAFQADDGEAARFRKEFKAPSDLSKEQWNSLSLALSPEPESRPTSCMALVRDLFATDTSPEQSAIPDMSNESVAKNRSAQSEQGATVIIEPLTAESLKADDIGTAEVTPETTAAEESPAQVSPVDNEPLPIQAETEAEVESEVETATEPEAPTPPEPQATSDVKVEAEPSPPEAVQETADPAAEVETHPPEIEPAPQITTEPERERDEPEAQPRAPKSGRDDAEEEGTDAVPPGPTFADRLGILLNLPEPIRRWLRRGLIFALGFITGVWLALLFYQGQLDSVSGQALTQMKNNRELRAAFDSLEHAYELQQQEIEHLRTTPAQPAPDVQTPTVESGSALREANRPVNNLTLFQDELKDGGLGPQMVVIPTGRFNMGDINGQGDDNEYPVHAVVIAHPFALSRHEVTFDEYDRFAKATGRTLPSDEGWGRGDRPVINVSWNDANAFTRWLTEQSGQPYRLPTESEWEYSARAGTESLYWWGGQPGQGHAVCDGCDTHWGGRQTAPVGSMKANPWGLYDMSGNVDEWVQDCYLPDYRNTTADGSAVLINTCTHRVMRGGSWFDIPRVVRPASRYRHPATSSRNSWGFRVALDLPDSMQ